MKSMQLSTLGFISLCIVTSTAGAQESHTAANDAAQPKGFYLGGSLGYAQGEVGASEINERMAQLGYEANARVNGQDRTAWSLNAGYRWNTYVETQVGYTDLGKVRTRLSGVAVDIDNYLNSANQIHPRSGSGYELTLLGRYPLGESYYLYGRAGVFIVDSIYRASSETDFANRERDENSEFFGVGLGKTLNRRWDLRLGIDRYEVEGETIPVLGFGAIYKFSSRTSPASTPVQPAIVAAPEPVPAPAPAIPESITLAILFDTDSAEIKEAFMGEVLRLAEFMQTNPDIKVTLEGHTDNRGSASYNQSLSTRRVQAVQAALITRAGIASERIEAIGYGEQKPIADNNTAEGQQANRRVVAVIH